MKFDIYIVDSFTDKIGGGNPAGVVFYNPITQDLTNETMKSIAGELGKSETAFITGEKAFYKIRWFSPKKEIPLCGHATLAAAKVLVEKHGEDGKIKMDYSDARLFIEHDSEQFSMVFPMDEYVMVEPDSIYKNFFLE